MEQKKYNGNYLEIYDIPPTIVDLGTYLDFPYRITDPWTSLGETTDMFPIVFPDELPISLQNANLYYFETDNPPPNERSRKLDTSLPRIYRAMFLYSSAYLAHSLYPNLLLPPIGFLSIPSIRYPNKLQLNDLLLNPQYYQQTIENILSSWVRVHMIFYGLNKIPGLTNEELKFMKEFMRQIARSGFIVSSERILYTESGAYFYRPSIHRSGINSLRTAIHTLIQNGHSNEEEVLKHLEVLEFTIDHGLDRSSWRCRD